MVGRVRAIKIRMAVSLFRKALRRGRRYMDVERSPFAARVMHSVYGLPEIELDRLIPGAELPGDVPILDHVCLPPHYGPKDHDDFAPLLKILSYYKPRNVLELGTAHGNLTANVCRFCPDARVYTVNAIAGEQGGVLTTYELGLEAIGQVYRNYGYSDRVVQILSDTMLLDLGSYFDRPLIDVAIVDACHDTRYVISDFCKVCPYVRRGGIVLLHDTHPSMEWHLAGSYIACMKLRRKGYNIRHISGTWWGAWVKA